MQKPKTFSSGKGLAPASTSMGVGSALGNSWLHGTPDAQLQRGAATRDATRVVTAARRRPHGDASRAPNKKSYRALAAGGGGGGRASGGAHRTHRRTAAVLSTPAHLKPPPCECVTSSGIGTDRAVDIETPDAGKSLTERSRRAGCTATVTVCGAAATAASPEPAPSAPSARRQRRKCQHSCCTLHKHDRGALQLPSSRQSGHGHQQRQLMTRTYGVARPRARTAFGGRRKHRLDVSFPPVAACQPRPREALGELRRVGLVALSRRSGQHTRAQALNPQSQRKAHTLRCIDRCGEHARHKRPPHAFAHSRQPTSMPGFYRLGHQKQDPFDMLRKRAHPRSAAALVVRAPARAVAPSLFHVWLERSHCVA